MRFQLLKILIVLAAAALFSHCAQIVPLSGGARDDKPPRLLAALPDLQSLRFSGSQIILRFDEFVQVKDLKNQVIITPRLKSDPEIEADGKKVIVNLNKEELLPNTTYRIYFGKAIADMHEGNTLNGFEYVFSTGDYIDTLKVQGKVTDAFNLTEAREVMVGLYKTGGVGRDLNPDLRDSLPHKKMPDYYVRTDQGGLFSIKNLPPANYQLVAFTDKNTNLLYEAEGERIGFLKESLKLEKDSFVNLSVFTEEPSRTFIKKTMTPYYGKAVVIYNRKCKMSWERLAGRDFSPDLGVSRQGLIFETNAGEEKDTLTLFFRGIEDTLSFLIRNKCLAKTDTVKLALPKLKLNKLKTLTVNNNFQGGVLAYGSKPELSFFNIIDSTKYRSDCLQLHYKKDTALMKESLKVSFPDPLTMIIHNPLSAGITYTLQSDTACLYDHNGRYNDSIETIFRLQSKAELGHLSLKLLFQKKQSYLVQLLNEREAVVRQERITLSLSSSNAASLDFAALAAGTYKVKIVFDDNENGKWDTGNYMKGMQAEKVVISEKQVKVIQDWDSEEEIKVK